MFAAWSDPDKNASGSRARTAATSWTSGSAGARRSTAATGSTCPSSEYYDIVPGERIVYTSALSANEALSTVLLTTVELARDGDGPAWCSPNRARTSTGGELPEWREQGTGDWLDALGQTAGLLDGAQHRDRAPDRAQATGRPQRPTWPRHRLEPPEVTLVVAEGPDQVQFARLEIRGECVELVPSDLH